MLPDNNILDIIISLVLIYALLSILVSVLVEWWNYKKKERAKFLKLAIFELINDPLNVHFGELFYSHYLIDGLRSKRLKAPPQYISSKLFAEVMIDIIANRKFHDKPITTQRDTYGKQYQLAAPQPDMDVKDRFRRALDELNPSPFSDTLQSFLDKSGGDQDKLKELLRFWFDDYMDRVSGWYKVRQRLKARVFGFLVAIALNVDSIHLVRMISLDDSLRNNLVQSAERVADQYNSLSDSAKQETEELENVFKKVFPDSTIRDADGSLRYLHIKDLLQKNLNDSIRRDSTIAQIESLDTLRQADSLSMEYRERVDRILNITASLNIPVGWDSRSAPLSWWKKQTDLAKQPPQIKSGKREIIIAYTDQRNQRSTKSVTLYIIGILISGFSLSFGAPFWFETLVKLINIRRAGKKPEQVNDKTK